MALLPRQVLCRPLRPAALLLVFALWPLGAAAEPFGAGSLIIPMDQCYNRSAGSAPTRWSGNACVAGPAPICYAASCYPDGDQRLAFGLVYLLAVNNIPVYIILRPDKVHLADPDFTITPPAGATTETVTFLRYSVGAYVADSSRIACGTNPVPYLGMPFVVPVADATRALAVMAQFNARFGTFRKLPVHVSNYPFEAPVASVIATRPKPVGLGPEFGLNTYFDETGINAVLPANSAFVEIRPTGVGYGYRFFWPATLPAHPGCPAGLCTGLVYTPAGGTPQRILDVLWTGDSDLQHWSALGPYFMRGGRALVVHTAVSAWERGAGSANFLSPSGLSGVSRGSAQGHFCPAVAAANPDAYPGPPDQYPASNLFLQIGDLAFVPVGGGLSAAWRFNGTPVAGTVGLTTVASGRRGMENDFGAIAGRPRVAGSATPGWLIYEGGGNAWHGNAAHKDAGRRIMYNTLLGGGDGAAGGGGGGGAGADLVPTELSRSSAVIAPGGAYYAGTFDWQIPRDPAAMGNTLYVPPVSNYPYVTGHFREYRPRSGLLVPDGTPYSLACDPAVPGSACTWDAASRIRPWAERNVYVGILGGGAPRLVRAAALSSDATIAHIAARIGTRLGGIDYSAAAVIEAKPTGPVTVAGARGRPTIAYVGARDGMIHAFCVEPETGQSQCYGSYARGAEIWAVILPGVKAQMDAARAAGDWSQVNVGGVLRVADVEDALDPDDASARVYRTVLIVGTRGSGHVAALDISNPDPRSVNQSGFRLLWQNDGTAVASGVSAVRFGATQGATLARLRDSALAIVTSAAASGAGVNTYALRLSDGRVLAVQQKRYTRRMAVPGGGAAPLPNDVPAPPTVLDRDGDGSDDTALVADLEGVVRRFALTRDGFSGQPTEIFDAGRGRCPSNIACQPISASPALLRRAVAPTLLAVVATGGADWNRDLGTPSYLLGFDATATGTVTALAAEALSTLVPPASAAPGGVTLPLPLRVYAQPSVAGTDLYVQATVLALGSVNQLLLPTLYPGSYGAVLRWRGVSGASFPRATVLLGQETSLGGGLSAVLQTDGTAGDGAVYVVGTSQIVRYVLPPDSPSMRNSAMAVNQSAQSGRPFTTRLWMDLEADE